VRPTRARSWGETALGAGGSDARDPDGGGYWCHGSGLAGDGDKLGAGTGVPCAVGRAAGATGSAS
jgi:hypothetical protein